ncbi:hypothetical protein [Phormidesmis priestleyi]|uniref:hypothetical protein n=1 Tax=Phormidesmis priestleyi TaxID=268141 RepID=UPI000A55176C|nr:hypothetical protein [Phormidesmis priestleyi]
MKRFNQPNQPNKSQIIDVSDETVAFMLSNGFSTDGSWYKWYKNRHQQPRVTEQ